jgi:hypothetical protein
MWNIAVRAYFGVSSNCEGISINRISGRRPSIELGTSHSSINCNGPLNMSTGNWFLSGLDGNQDQLLLLLCGR